MEDLNLYLQNPADYQTGVRLLEKYSKLTKMLPYLKQANNPPKSGQHFRILLGELLKCKNNLAAKVAAGVIKPPAPAPVEVKAIDLTHINPVAMLGKVEIVKQNPKVNYNDLPSNLKELYNETGRMNSKLQLLRNLITRTDISEADREQAAQELVVLDHNIKENWGVIDAYYDPERKAKAEAREKEKEAKSERVQQIANLKSNISKWKVKHANALDRGDNVLAVKAETKLKEFEDELKRVQDEK